MITLKISDVLAVLSAVTTVYPTHIYCNACHGFGYEFEAGNKVSEFESIEHYEGCPAKRVYDQLRGELGQGDDHTS